MLKIVLVRTKTLYTHFVHITEGFKTKQAVICTRIAHFWPDQGHLSTGIMMPGQAILGQTTANENDD